MGNFWAVEENVVKLLELNEQGMSAGQISRALGGGVSRNAIIGKLNRLGVGMKGGSAPTRPVRIPKKQSAPRVTLVPVEEPVIAEEPLTLEDGSRVTLLTISDRMCRWPIGDPCASDFHFCGRSPKSGAPYCDAHCRKAYTPAITAESRKKGAEVDAAIQDRQMRRVAF